MKLNLIICGSVYSRQCGYSALQFANQAVVAGHTLSQIFFYQDGVSQANSLAVPLSDEFNAVDEWVSLAEQTGSKLVVCVSSAERRGVINTEQQHEFAKDAANLHPMFQVEGLGAMLDASLDADRTVTFR